MQSPDRPRPRWSRPSGTVRRLVLAAAVLLAPLASLAAGVEQSVVRLVNFSQRGNWYSPWDVSTVVESGGSGFVVEGGLVMTNAHVVSDSRMLLLFLHNDPEAHYAEVFLLGHDCDLALVRPVEPDLLLGVPPLEFGGLPRLGSAVDTLGYPAGGTQLSSTRGVVSRIEDQLYLHSSADSHLTVQTDAAINPGNSGGPVFQDGRVVGVAFQAIPDLQSVGYFIPTEVTERFLRDAADGSYEGYPELGVQTTGLANPAERRQAGLGDGETGARVEVVYPGSSAEGRIVPGDIVLEVEGRPVANDGTVADGELRFPFGLLVDRLQIGERVRLRLVREGRRIDVDVPLVAYPHAARHGHAYDRLPRYFVYGGLVFVPLELELMGTFGPDWPAVADKGLLHEFLVRPFEEPAQLAVERVVLLRRLDHPVNAGMAWSRNQVVDRVNGREIAGLEDLVRAFEAHDGEYHFLEFSTFGRVAVLERSAAEAAHEEILRRYGVPQDRNL